MEDLPLRKKKSVTKRISSQLRVRPRACPPLRTAPGSVLAHSEPCMCRPLPAAQKLALPRSAPSSAPASPRALSSAALSPRGPAPTAGSESAAAVGGLRSPSRTELQSPLRKPLARAGSPVKAATPKPAKGGSGRVVVVDVRAVAAPPRASPAKRPATPAPRKQVRGAAFTLCRCGCGYACALARHWRAWICSGACCSAGPHCQLSPP